MEVLSKRLKNMPCPIGLKSMCCRNCLMGPCRILTKKDVGVCGANLDVIASRNLLRFTASGASAHAGHALHLLNFLGRKFPENYIEKKAPKYLVDLWKKIGILPKIKYEHFKEISEALHATTMGVNANYQDLLVKSVRIGIVDGYLGLYLATELEDKKYGKPKVRKGKLNLGVIKPEKVNIAVHGHEAIFAEALVNETKKDKEINLIGVCCTGASLLAKHGIPLAANVVLQEEVILTGAIDVMAVDLQCVMPSIVDIAECFQTKIITTSNLAKISGAIHKPVETKEDAVKVAREVIKIAKENFKKRRKDIIINEKESEAIVGFDESVAEKLNKKLKNKEIDGIIAFVGCKNPRVSEDWISIINKLSKKYAILTTGCMAFELGKNGLLDGERFYHLGSCINNSRVAEVFRIIAKKNNKKITEMPFLVSAPMPLTEKCIAIGLFFASLGVDVHFGYPMMIKADSNMEDFLKKTLKKHFHSRIFLEENPEKLYNELKKGLIS